MLPTNHYKTLSFILAISILLLGSTIYVLLTSKCKSAESMFLGTKKEFKTFKAPFLDASKRGKPIGRSDVDPIVGAYHDYIDDAGQMDLKFKSGLLHDSGSLKDYISTYKAFIIKHPIPKSLSDQGYYWQIGFYYAISNDGTENKLNCCLIPTLVSDKVTGKNHVLDYYIWNDKTVEGNPIYPPRTSSKDNEELFMYDTGEIFP